MADSKVTITQGTGTDIDTRTNAEGEHRQVIVIGDPLATAGVAPVHSSYGLSVDVRNIASSITVPVSATDLDIRNLSSASDSVKVEGGNTSDVKVTLDNERVDVQRVHNVVDGTINIGDISKGTQTNDVKITLDGERPDIQRVHNLVDGTVSVGNTVTIQDGGNSITVDGTVTANAGSGTMAVNFSPSEPTVKVKTGETIAVYFSPSNPSVNATFSGSISAVPETGSGDSIYDETKNALVVTPHPEGTMAVYFSPSNPSVNATFSGSIEAVPVTGSGTKLYDDSVDALKICDGGNVISVDDGGGSLTIDGTVTANAGSGTMAVQFSPSEPTVQVKDLFSTSIIPSVVSGSTTAVSQEGGVIVSPETGRNIKVYAFSLTSTTNTGVIVKFTDGANELWRYKLLAPSGGMAGANLAVTPPGYLFATGTGNTLCVVLDSAEETHYSVSYFKESG